MTIVGHQPEPKLIASRLIAKAARCSRSPAENCVRGSGAAGASSGRACAYAAIASVSICTNRAAAATRAQARRTRSGSGAVLVAVSASIVTVSLPARRALQPPDPLDRRRKRIDRQAHMVETGPHVAGKETDIRRGGVEDAAAIARLLHDFNEEYEEPTPGVEALAGYARKLLETGEMTVLLAGATPAGIAVIRFRTAIWTGKPEAHLQELYVQPPLRGHGIGRALLEATIAVAREAGATGIDLNTGETDTAARGLYESFGFTNREGAPDGPSMLFYEREI